MDIQVRKKRFAGRRAGPLLLMPSSVARLQWQPVYQTNTINPYFSATQQLASDMVWVVLYQKSDFLC
jgi:hypothetical protein